MDNLITAIEKWMAMYKRTSVKPSTYDRLVSSLDQLKKYPIADISIDTLTTNDIQSYLNTLVQDGYALSTIKKQLHLISGFMTYANLNDIITKPLHKGVSLPSQTTVKKPKRDIVAYSYLEQERLKKVMLRGESPVYFMDLFILETGLRIGEAMALGWSDVDWGRKAIRVSKTLVRLGNSKKCYVQQSAKSFTSNRTIPLSREAFRLLKQLHESNDAGSTFVFHNAVGDHLTYEAVRYWTKKACREAKVPYYGQHVFRHSFATNCYQRGCDVKLLSRFLGHSDVTITYNVYIHLFGDALEEMRSVLD